MFSATDEALVKRALRGKAQAWDQLIRRYERRVFNFALRMTGNREDALDLMQDILLAVYRNLASFRHEAPFRSWLFGIASFRASDFFRKRKALDPLPEGELPVDEHSPAANPFLHVARDQTNRQIMDLLGRLPCEQRLVVELKFFQDQTFEEMSLTLGVSSNTLKSRLYGALRKMKNMPEVTHAM